MDSVVCFSKKEGKSTKYRMGSTMNDKTALSEVSCWLLCSVVSKAIEAMTATNKRVLIDGPLANISFIVNYLSFSKTHRY